MLSHEEYNAIFDVDLSEEQFNKIMNMPLNIMNDNLDLLVIADHNGNKREFVPKKRGEWVDHTIPGGTKRYVCSYCGKNAMFDLNKWDQIRSNFCPNCGADMRGETDGN